MEVNLYGLSDKDIELARQLTDIHVMELDLMDKLQELFPDATAYELVTKWKAVREAKWVRFVFVMKRDQAIEEMSREIERLSFLSDDEKSEMNNKAVLEPFQAAVATSWREFGPFLFRKMFDQIGYEVGKEE